LVCRLIAISIATDGDSTADHDGTTDQKRKRV